MVLAAAAAALLLGPPPGRTRLLGLALPSQRARDVPAPIDLRTRNGPFLASAQARTASAVLVGLAGCWLVGGFGGLALGIVLGSAVWRVLVRLQSRATVRLSQARAQAVPLVAQLLATAVAAGSPPVSATEVVADALGGPMGELLRSAAASARLGTDPAGGLLLLPPDPDVRSLARALARSMTRGTSPVSVLDRLAHDARDTARWAAEARARSLGARAAAPLGLCFLPAFVLVGIVPVVATAGRLLP